MASNRLEDILQAAIDFNLLNEKGKLSPWSSLDYQRAADKINIKGDCPKISRDYLYIILKNNRYNILDTLKSKYGIEVTPKSPENFYKSDFSDEEIENKSLFCEGKI